MIYTKHVIIEHHYEHNNMIITLTLTFLFVLFRISFISNSL
jgi:hypothetical protein